MQRWRTTREGASPRVRRCVYIAANGSTGGARRRRAPVSLGQTAVTDGPERPVGARALCIGCKSARLQVCKRSDSGRRWRNVCGRDGFQVTVTGLVSCWCVSGAVYVFSRFLSPTCRGLQRECGVSGLKDFPP